MEPPAAVPLNNELAAARGELYGAEEAVLWRLTGDVGDARYALQDTLDKVGRAGTCCILKHTLDRVGWPFRCAYPGGPRCKMHWTGWAGWAGWAGLALALQRVARLHVSRVGCGCVAAALLWRAGGRAVF